MAGAEVISARLAAWAGLTLCVACDGVGPADGGRPDATGPTADAAPMQDAATPTDAGATAHARADRYPIEVVGLCPEDGSACRSVELRVDLGPEVVDGPVELLLTTHNLVQARSADVVIDGAWTVPLTNPGSPLLRPQGGIARGAIALPDGAAHAGEISLVFRYTRQVPDVSGYRVLAVALRLGDRRVDVELPMDDPSTWAAYDPAEDAVSRGRTFFESVSRDGGPTCARCHTDSGSDFAYFAFSNETIVERARFHLFSRAEAEDIASYLRSHEQGAVGRVFDPPFQPGTANHGAAGAGAAAVVDDDAFGEAVFGASGLGDEVAWDWAASVDTYRLPAPVQAPSWFRWLPRVLDEAWLTRPGAADGTTVAAAEQALRDDPSLENAARFMRVAVAVGKELFAEDRTHDRIDLLRFAAVKLWEWSRRHGFDGDDHGFPIGTPPYPYEVGFAFFESAHSIPDGYLQAMEWWWVQIALDPGRGASDGRRPLDWHDVLVAAEGAGLGRHAITFLHLYGSFEESRGPMAGRWGESVGPARLLSIPMRHLDAPARAALLRRFFRKEAEWIGAGGAVGESHLDDVERAWREGCEGFGAATLAELRALAPSPTREVLTACP